MNNIQSSEKSSNRYLVQADPAEIDLVKEFVRKATQLLGDCFEIKSVRRSYALGYALYINVRSNNEILSIDQCEVLFDLALDAMDRAGHYVEAVIDSWEEGGESLDLAFLAQAQEPVISTQPAMADITTEAD